MRVITGSAKGTRLKTPEGMQTRPTTERVKEALFSSLHYSLPGKSVLDLFAGTGQLGIEALSRGAQSAVFVDNRKDAVALVQENLRRTKLLQQATVVQSDYLSYLAVCRQKFDVIFLDPPYAETFLENALRKIVEFDILTAGGIIVGEWPALKGMNEDFDGLVRLKEHRYGKIILTEFGKDPSNRG